MTINILRNFQNYAPLMFCVRFQVLSGFTLGEEKYFTYHAESQKFRNLHEPFLIKLNILHVI